MKGPLETTVTTPEGDRFRYEDGVGWFRERAPRVERIAAARPRDWWFTIAATVSAGLWLVLLLFLLYMGLVSTSSRHLREITACLRETLSIAACPQEDRLDDAVRWWMGEADPVELPAPPPARDPSSAEIQDQVRLMEQILEEGRRQDRGKRRVPLD